MVVRTVHDSITVPAGSPSITQTGKCKQGIVPHAEVEGLFLFPATPPFDKPVDETVFSTINPSCVTQMQVVVRFTNASCLKAQSVLPSPWR